MIPRESAHIGYCPISAALMGVASFTLILATRIQPCESAGMSSAQITSYRAITHTSGTEQKGITYGAATCDTSWVHRVSVLLTFVASGCPQGQRACI